MYDYVGAGDVPSDVRLGCSQNKFDRSDVLVYSKYNDHITVRSKRIAKVQVLRCLVFECTKPKW